MLPQHVLEEGGYHIKGKQEAEHQKLLDDAKALADAGAFAIVLELVMPPVAKEISQSISVPTIGIGSGPDCDGQILVTQGFNRHVSVVHAAFCEAEGELRGGNQIGGGGVEKRNRRAMMERWRRVGCDFDVCTCRSWLHHEINGAAEGAERFSRGPERGVAAAAGAGGRCDGIGGGAKSARAVGGGVDAGTGGRDGELHRADEPRQIIITRQAKARRWMRKFC